MHITIPTNNGDRKNHSTGMLEHTDEANCPFCHERVIHFSTGGVITCPHFKDTRCLAGNRGGFDFVLSDPSLYDRYMAATSRLLRYSTTFSREARLTKLGDAIFSRIMEAGRGRLGI